MRETSDRLISVHRLEVRAMIYECGLLPAASPGRKPALLVAVRERDAADLGEGTHPPGRVFWTTLIGKSSERSPTLLAWDSICRRRSARERFSPIPNGSQWSQKTEKDGQASSENISSPVAGASRGFSA